MPKRKAVPTPAKASEKPAKATPPTRASKRIKLTPSGAESVEKSKYFEVSDEAEEPVSEPEQDEKGSETGYEDTDAVSEESDSAEEEESDSEDDRKRTKRGKPAKKKQSSSPEAESYENKELWREGVKTGLGPGKAVFIQKPKARGDGGIKYMPNKIHPNTLEFLRDLKRNNDRMWLKAHDPDYRTSWKDWESFVEVLSEKIAEIDETVPELPPKDLVFRIYRDVRFSKDPTPYKTNFSAAFSRTGRKGPYACYYVSLQPGDKSFVGCGLWHPDAAPLALVRNDIDQNPDNIRNVLAEPQMRKEILSCSSKDTKKAVQAFCKRNAENALKTKPKGYDADHPNIELLRLRNFTIGHNIPDSIIIGPNGLDRILELIAIMFPFVTYLNGVVMPDADSDAEQQGSSSPEDNGAEDLDNDSDDSETA